MIFAPGTQAFYDDWAAHGVENPRSAISKQFEATFVAGSRVLDVGCGKGRDLVALLDMGFDAYGVEPHDAMRAQALARDARVEDRIAAASLPDLGQPFGGGFDGLVCSAVLMHVNVDALAASLTALSAVLKPSARVLMALPQMQQHLLVEGRDPDGRQFDNHTPEHVQDRMASLGFALARRADIVTPSADTVWRALVFAR